jgi:flagellar motor switch protein FliN/FliY
MDDAPTGADGMKASGATDDMDEEKRPPSPPAHPDASSLRALYDIPVNITVVLGRTHMEVAELMALGKGDVVELDRKVGESIDILVNNRLVARGEVVLVEDQLGITLTEIIKNKAVA